jgi:uncharacterized protein
MNFEFDPEKSEGNKNKHGINFVEAEELWNDPYLLEIHAKTTDEMRLLVIGVIGGKHWTGIITYRNDSIRIISVRRAGKEEIDLYES